VRAQGRKIRREEECSKKKEERRYGKKNSRRVQMRKMRVDSGRAGQGRAPTAGIRSGAGAANPARLWQSCSDGQLPIRSFLAR